MDWIREGPRRKISGDYELFCVDNSKDRAVIWEKEKIVKGGDLEGKISSLGLGDLASLLGFVMILCMTQSFIPLQLFQWEALPAYLSSLHYTIFSCWAVQRLFAFLVWLSCLLGDRFSILPLTPFCWFWVVLPSCFYSIVGYFIMIL